MKKINLLKSTLLALFVMIGSVAWSQTGTVTITRDNFDAGALAYGTDDEWTAVASTGDIIKGIFDIYSTAGQETLQTRTNTPIGSYPHNTIAIPGPITKITINGGGTGAVRNWTPYLSESPLNKANFKDDGIEQDQKGAGENTSASWEIDPNNGFTYFYLNLSSNGAVFLSSIEIEFSTDTQQTPKAAAPSFSPTGGTYYGAIEVELSSSTDGATIYYTTNGNDPTTSSTKYASPIAVSTTTTIKAIAVKDGLDDSAVVTANYDIMEIAEVSNIAVLRAVGEGSIVKLTGEAVVTLVSSTRNTKFIQDATGAIVIDDAAGLISETYTIGDGIKDIIGTLNPYNGLLQFVPVSNPGTPSSTGNSIEPTVVDLADLSDYQSHLVKIEDVIIDGTGNFSFAQNYNLNGGNNPLLRTHLQLDYIGQPIPAGEQNIVGVVIQFNDNIQFVPRSLAEFTNASGIEMVAAPVITPETGTYTDTQTIEISSATEGATIYYTLDGNDPTTSSTKYTAPFEVSTTTTVKAIAVKDGAEDSSVAEVTLTFATIEGDGTEANPYTVADVKTMNIQDSDGEKYWVKGFIVGNVGNNSAGNITSIVVPGNVKTNLALAGSADEDDTTTMISVQLPNNNAREELNLVDNPELLGSEVMVYGTLDKYFGTVAGVKSVTDYRKPPFTDVENTKAELQIWSSGKTVFFNATAGETVELFNLAGQKMQTHIANDGVNALTLSTTGVVIVKAGDRVSKVIVK